MEESKDSKCGRRRLRSSVDLKNERECSSEINQDIGTPKCDDKDSMGGCKSEMDTLKKSRSKYKGKSVYHSLAKNGLNGSNKKKKASSEKSSQNNEEEKVSFLNKLKANFNRTSDNNSQKVINEIEETSEKDYFGELSGDDQPYDQFLNYQPQENEEIAEETGTDKLEVRRSKRRVARTSFADINEHGIAVGDEQEEDEYRLIKCSQYENGPESQPLQVYISFQSFLFMNIHAHLFSNEIIGFNAGHVFTHTNGKKAIYFHDVYPVDPIEDTEADRSKSVEMNPESSELNRKLAESRGQTICGWYHSHPIFDTNPSRIDITNQHMYQDIFNKDGNKPFVAFIVGPYSPRLNS